MQVLAGPGQRFAIGLAVTEQVALKSFDHGLGDGGRREQVTFNTPQGEAADVEGSFLDGGGEKL